MTVTVKEARAIGVVLSELYQAAWRPAPSRKDLEAAVDVLADAYKKRLQMSFFVNQLTVPATRRTVNR